MKDRVNNTMWIRSQNKEQLVKCIAFSITRNYGGRKKSAIVGTVSNASWWGKEVILGFYDTKEAAINEITRLQAELFSATEVYEMG